MDEQPVPGAPAIWMADVARAARRLRADGHTGARIAELLGLRSAPAPSSPAGSGALPEALVVDPPPRPREMPPPRTPHEVVGARAIDDPDLPAERPIVEREPAGPAGRSRPPRRLPSVAELLDGPRGQLSVERATHFLEAATVRIVAGNRSGTGLLVTPGWAVTASAVVTDRLRAPGESSASESPGDPLVLWRGHQLAAASFALLSEDVALLRVRMPDGETFSAPPIATDPPGRNDGVAIFAPADTSSDTILVEVGAVIGVPDSSSFRLRPTGTPEEITPGYAGAPVLHLNTMTVCGLVTGAVATAPGEIRAASLTSAMISSIPDVIVGASTGPVLEIRLEPTTLLPPGRQRAILSALCSGPAATDIIDVDELVEWLARREPIRMLPMTVGTTTRRGVQMLVDFGDGMRPFAQDQEEVLQTLERIAGPDGFEVLRFAVTPLDEPGAGPGPMWTWTAYRPPLAGQPVIVLSDLGAGSRPDIRSEVQARWLQFARMLREAGHQVVTLAPMPARRYPIALRTAMSVLTWDRSTNVAEAIRVTRNQAARVSGRSR